MKNQKITRTVSIANMESNERFRHYITSITEALLDNNISELHRMADDANFDYARDNITYKQLYVIKLIVATFIIATRLD